MKDRLLGDDLVEAAVVDDPAVELVAREDVGKESAPDDLLRNVAASFLKQVARASVCPVDKAHHLVALIPHLVFGLLVERASCTPKAGRFRFGGDFLCLASYFS